MNNSGDSYSVSDYKLFDTACSTIADFVNKINTTSADLESKKAELAGGSIFMGPICDSAVEGFGKVGSKLSTDVSSCNQFSSTLKEISTNYKNGDTSAKNFVINSDGTLSTSGAPTKVAGDAVEWAKKIAADDSYGYINGGMGDGGYDCTQFVHAAYQAAGLDMSDRGNHNQSTIVDYYTGMGFTWHPGTIDPNELQAGDVLVNQAHHAEMYIGNGQKVGAHDNYDGGAGDSQGNEISIDDYKEYGNGGWDGYLRYEGA